ncbi:MAG: hypothetical protein ACPL1Z_05945 [Candidatus Bathyarchaeales archaeon]
MRLRTQPTQNWNMKTRQSLILSYVLANAMIEDYLKDEERVKALIKRLKLQAGSPIH